MSTTSSKTLGYVICGAAGLAGSSACLYATDHRSAFLITAVIAAVITVLIIGFTALILRRAGHHRSQTSTVNDDTTAS